VRDSGGSLFLNVRVAKTSISRPIVFRGLLLG
jgi:hypothetical protein